MSPNTLLFAVAVIAVIGLSTANPLISRQQQGANGLANGQTNGKVNGQGNGQGNGQDNGQNNMEDNGQANGQGNGQSFPGNVLIGGQQITPGSPFPTYNQGGQLISGPRSPFDRSIFPGQSGGFPFGDDQQFPTNNQNGQFIPGQASPFLPFGGQFPSNGQPASPYRANGYPHQNGGNFQPYAGSAPLPGINFNNRNDVSVNPSAVNPSAAQAEPPAPTDGNGESPAPTNGNGESPAPTNGNGESPAPTNGNGESPAPTNGNGAPSATNGGAPSDTEQAANATA